MPTTIKNIHARQILDSRGNPTLEVEVTLFSGVSGKASVPSGASTGQFEALELRDNGNEYNGKTVQKAIENIHKKISPTLINKNVTAQYDLDKMMIDIDGTANKSKLGANAILGVSMAIAKTASNSFKMPLYKYLGGINATTIPVPMMNILNGGVHANNGIEFQEFMIAPVGAKSFTQALQMGSEIFHALQRILKSENLSIGVGDEGGFAPKLRGNVEAIELIIEAIQLAKYSTDNVKICLDIASSEFYKNERYHIAGNQYDTNEFIEILEAMVTNYPIISIEDGLYEDDFEGWQKLTEKIGHKCQLVGDDFFVTNVSRIKQGVKEKCANSVLIKLNQIGTVSETLEAIKFAQNSNYTTVISHRSGETEDTFIADLAVGVNSGLIKTGSLSRGERISKYNRLLKIESELSVGAKYLGKNAFKFLK